MFDVCVIGGGAAGLMAAGAAAGRGLKTVILERNEKVARKVMITGKGRCNITNAIEIGDFIEKVPGNGNFLYSAFYSFTNEDVIKFFNDLSSLTIVQIQQPNRELPVTFMLSLSTCPTTLSSSPKFSP